jgi:hypothetical protein
VKGGGLLTSYPPDICVVNSGEVAKKVGVLCCDMCSSVSCLYLLLCQDMMIVFVMLHEQVVALLKKYNSMRVFEGKVPLSYRTQYLKDKE